MTNLQLKNLFSTCDKDEHPVYSEDYLSDDIIQSFKKNHTIQEISLDDMKKYNNMIIPDYKENNRFSVSVIISLISMFLYISSTHLFDFTQLNTIVFNFFTSFLGMISVGAVCMSVTFKFLAKLKSFNLSKERETFKKFISVFLLNHNELIINLKDKLYQDLNNKNIQESNHFLYSYFKDSISDLDTQCKTLVYELEKQLFLNEYSSQALDKFITYYSQLCANIALIDDVKILNEI